MSRKTTKDFNRALHNHVPQTTVSLDGRCGSGVLSNCLRVCCESEARGKFFRGSVTMLLFLTRFGHEVFRGTVNVFAVCGRCACASHVTAGHVDIMGSIGRDYAVWRRFEETGAARFGFLTVGLHFC